MITMMAGAANKLSIWDDVNFCLSNKAEQFAHFIVRIYQLVQERSFPFSNPITYSTDTRRSGSGIKIAQTTDE